MADEDQDLDRENSEEGLEDVDLEEGGSGKIKKIFLFVLVPILVLLLAGVGLYFSGMLDGVLGKNAEEETGTYEEKEYAEEKKKGPGVFFEMPSIIVNLSSKDGTSRYLKLRVQLELAEDKDLVIIENIAPRVMDHFQTYLRELREEDLRGSAGIYRLRLELLSRVNAAVHPIEVKDILFQDILVQ